jgi:hypothetical protein
MVKTTAALPLLFVVLLAGCASRQLVDLHPQTLRISAGGVGPVSLVRLGDSLLGVFAQRSTASLDSFLLPLAPRMPGTPPAVKVIDVVDVAPPLSAAFGTHLLRSSGDAVMLLYEDRISAETTALKLATRASGDAQWTLKVLDPPGAPLQVIPSPPGGYQVFWATDGILTRSLPGTVSTLLVPSFRLAGLPADLGGSGFVARNREDDTLYAVQRTGDMTAVRRFQVTGEVFSSTSAHDGAVSILSWDRRTRRLVLYEEAAPGGSLRRTTVTVCDGTGTVALLPGVNPGAHTFVFDEIRRRAGRTMHDVSIIAPAGALHRNAGGYRKSVLYESDQPVEGFSVVQTQDALYVLVQTDELTLVRAAVQGPPSNGN